MFTEKKVFRFRFNLTRNNQKLCWKAPLMWYVPTTPCLTKSLYFHSGVNPTCGLRSVTDSCQASPPPFQSPSPTSPPWYVWVRPSPISLDSGLLPLLSCCAEQCLLIGSWDREGSLGSIYRDSLIYQNNNIPPPHREREKERGKLTFGFTSQGNVHTRTNFVLLN